jgi:hypothetical protein
MVSICEINTGVTNSDSEAARDFKLPISPAPRTKPMSDTVEFSRRAAVQDPEVSSGSPQNLKACFEF